jgi:DNA-binding IclR family transcriptional regulator
MDEKSGNTIQSIETAFDIVELLRKKGGAGVTEISDELGIPVSTTHNHLNTLQQKGYLLQKEGDYHVGLKFVYFGDHVKNQLDVYTVGEQYVNQLADETGEVANLLVENGGFGVYLKVVRGEDALDLDSYSRRREYLHCTAQERQS